MELYLYLAIVRRHWLFVLALPLLVAALSLAVGLTRPPVYGVTVRLLVTRGMIDAGSRAGLTAGGNEDTVAYDLPAVISGAPFRRDLAALLAQQGRPLDEAVLVGALTAANQRHLVTLTATAAQPDTALALAQAAVRLLQTNGLRYWNEPRATPERPGLNIAVLEFPPTAARVNGLRAVLVDAGLRTLAATLAGIGLAFLLHYVSEGRWRRAVPPEQNASLHAGDDRANTQTTGSSQPIPNGRQ